MSWLAHLSRACIACWSTFSNTCIFGNRDIQSDSDDSKELKSLEKGWNPGDHGNDQTDHTEQPAGHVKRRISTMLCR